MQCRSVDASFFADIVSINPVPYTQSRYLHLVCLLYSKISFVVKSDEQSFENSLIAVS